LLVPFSIAASRAVRTAEGENNFRLALSSAVRQIVTCPGFFLKKLTRYIVSMMSRWIIAADLK
jgi:hypothetical protein